MAYNVVACGLD